MPGEWPFAAGVAASMAPILAVDYRLFVDRTIPPVEELDSTITTKKPERNP
jgi:hypothetical protein